MPETRRFQEGTFPFLALALTRSAQRGRRGCRTGELPGRVPQLAKAGKQHTPPCWLSQHALGVLQLFILGRPSRLGGSLGPREPFPADRDTHCALAGLPLVPLLDCRSFQEMDLAGAVARPLASLATLVTAVGHPLGCTLRKALPVDLHETFDVATSCDIVEACFMQRAPLPRGRLRDDAYGTAVPSSSTHRGDGSWLNGQGASPRCTCLPSYLC
jgi:hypothetical protein